jgi:hypothetical protein
MPLLALRKLEWYVCMYVYTEIRRFKWGMSLPFYFLHFNFFHSYSIKSRVENLPNRLELIQILKRFHL